jgi:MFS family permease
MIQKDLQYYKFSAYGFLKNFKFFDPFIILFFREMGLSFLQIGALISIREIATTILEVPTGLIADAYGRRNAMVFAFLSYILSFLIFYFVPIFLLYGVAMIFFGVGEAFRTGTHKAMIMHYLEISGSSHLKVEYYGHTRGWAQVGSAVSALIAGALVFYAGSYRIVFIASVIPYIGGLLLMLSYPSVLNSRRRHSEGMGVFEGIVGSIRDTFQDFFAVFRDVAILRILFNSSLYDGLFKSVKDYLQPILKSFALSVPVLLSLRDKRSTVLISVTYFLLYILTSVSSKNAHRALKSFQSTGSAVNVSYVLGICLTLMAGVFFALNLEIMTILIFISLYLAMNIRRPMTVSYVSDHIDTRVMATGLSVESQLKTIAVALFAPLLGLLSDLFGIGVGIIVIACIPLALFPVVRVTAGSRSAR